MHRKILIALVAAIAIAAWSTGLAVGSGPAVSVKIQNGHKVLKNVTVHGESGKVRGKCSGNSGAGALDVATHGKWVGSYSSSLHDFFVTSILGVKPTGKHYWAIYVNGKVSNTGVCGIKLRVGEKLLFKVK